MSEEIESRTGVMAKTVLCSTRQKYELTNFEPNSLSPKTARLQQRRKATTDGAGKQLPQGPTQERREISLITEDGAVGYFLRQESNVLLVRREQRRPLGVCSTQSITLACRTEFDRWLSTDAVRYDHPLIYARLCSIGREYFDAE